MQAINAKSNQVTRDGYSVSTYVYGVKKGMHVPAQGAKSREIPSLPETFRENYHYLVLGDSILYGLVCESFA